NVARDGYGDFLRLAVFRVDLLGHPLASVGLAARNDDLGAVFGHAFGDRLADALCGSSDKGDLAGKIEQVHFSSAADSRSEHLKRKPAFLTLPTRTRQIPATNGDEKRYEGKIT